MRKDGGPAFPLAVTAEVNEQENGMSLRDFFEGCALAGLCANPEHGSEKAETLAGWAQEQAEAMLRVRDR